MEKNMKASIRGTARDKTELAKMDQCLDRSESLEVEELELLLGPDESEVDLREISTMPRRKKGCRIVQIFSLHGPSEFLVVSAARWDECSRMLATQEQELSKVIEYMSEMQEQLLAVMERKKSLVKEAPEDFRKYFFFKKSGSWMKESLEKKWKNIGESMKAAKMKESTRGKIFTRLTKQNKQEEKGPTTARSPNDENTIF